MQHLHRDGAPRLPIARSVDGAHPALAGETFNLEALRDDVSGFRWFAARAHGIPERRPCHSR